MGISRKIYSDIRKEEDKQYKRRRNKYKREYSEPIRTHKVQKKIRGNYTKMHDKFGSEIFD